MDTPETNYESEQPAKPRSMRKQLIFSLFVILFLLCGTVALVLYGRGYRLGFNRGPQLTKTGILNASSTPKGAQVYVNDHLVTATNNTVNLTPGQYTVRIEKDGYIVWRKNIEIHAQEVTDADALLFPSAPSLQSISTFGVDEPLLDPSGTKLAFRINGSNLKKNGIYVLDMTARTFPVLAGQSTSTQVVDDTSLPFSTAFYNWSPDGQQLLASVGADLTNQSYYLLQANTFNNAPQDVTPTLLTVFDAWKTQRTSKEQARLASLKPALQQIIAKQFRIIAWSPDETKILYQALTSEDLPTIIKPRRIGNNLLYERRDVKKDGVYVYNITEDVNTRIIESSPPLCYEADDTCQDHTFTWFPDSYHLLYVHDKKIEIVEDDGSNTSTIYAGPFVDHYVYPWPDASKILILTNLGNTNTSPTLYTISLK